MQPYYPPPPQPPRFDFGDVLGKGFSIYFRNLPAFLLMATLIYTPLILFAIVTPNPLAGVDTTTELSTKVVEYSLLIGLGGMLLQFVLAGAVTFGVIEEHSGRHAGIGQCLTVGFRRLLPTLAVTLLSGLCIMAGVLALIVGAFVVMCMLYVAVPASVIERRGVGNALSRSAFLTKGYRWWILLLFMIVGFGSGMLAGVLEQVLVHHIDVDGTRVIDPEDFKKWAVLQVAVQVVLAPLQSTMAATTYVALRRLKEGVPADDLSKVFG